MGSLDLSVMITGLILKLRQSASKCFNITSGHISALITSQSILFYRQLGFDYGISQRESYYGEVPSDFAMDIVFCGSNTEFLQDCEYQDETTENCSSLEGAGVQCYYDHKV